LNAKKLLMENVNYPVLFALGLLVFVVLVWAIYRNFKDEKKFEKNLDDPKREFDIHHDRKKT